MAADRISKSARLRRTSSSAAAADADDAGVIVAAAAAVGPRPHSDGDGACQGRHVGKLRRLFQLATAPLLSLSLHGTGRDGTAGTQQTA